MPGGPRPGPRLLIAVRRASLQLRGRRCHEHALRPQPAPSPTQPLALSPPPARAPAGFSTSGAVALSNITIMGGTLVNLAFNMGRQHPLRQVGLCKLVGSRRQSTRP